MVNYQNCLYHVLLGFVYLIGLGLIVASGIHGTAQLNDGKSYSGVFSLISDMYNGSEGFFQNAFIIIISPFVFIGYSIGWLLNINYLMWKIILIAGVIWVFIKVFYSFYLLNKYFRITKNIEIELK